MGGGGGNVYFSPTSLTPRPHVRRFMNRPINWTDIVVLGTVANMFGEMRARSRVATVCGWDVSMVATTFLNLKKEQDRFGTRHENGTSEAHLTLSVLDRVNC